MNDTQSVATSASDPTAEGSVLGLVGLSFKTAPISVRETLARTITPDKLLQLKRDKSDELGNMEMVLLSTCNRIELYYYGSSQLSQVLERLFMVDSEEGYHVYNLTDYSAVNQLFKVAAGLDSLVLGEEQVISQVRDAGKLCFEKGLSGPVLSKLFAKASQTGRIARQENPKLDAGLNNSVSDAVMQFISQTYRQKKPNLLLVGSGKMIRLAVSAIDRSKLGTVVVAARKRTLAGIEADLFVPLLEIGQRIEEEKIDVVITATSADSYLLSPKDLESLKSQLLVIDISVPRNVDPRVAELRGVRLINIDDLKEYVLPSEKRYSELATKIGEQVSSSAEDFLALVKEDDEIEPVLSSLRKKAEVMRSQELENALVRMPDLTQAEREVIEKMTERLLSRLLHQPTAKLRKLARDHEKAGKAREYLLAMSELFSVEEEESKPKKRASTLPNEDLPQEREEPLAAKGI